MNDAQILGTILSIPMVLFVVVVMYAISGR